MRLEALRTRFGTCESAIHADSDFRSSMRGIETEYCTRVDLIPTHFHNSLITNWCPRRDSNSHAVKAQASETCVSTNSTTRACKPNHPTPATVTKDMRHRDGRSKEPPSTACFAIPKRGTTTLAPKSTASRNGAAQRRAISWPPDAALKSRQSAQPKGGWTNGTRMRVVSGSPST